MEFPSVILSVNPLVIKNIITEGYTNEMKRVILFFYFWMIKNYRWRIHRRSISVGDVVGKLITDGICVLHRRKNSVGKTVKSCSGLSKLFVLLLRKTRLYVGVYTKINIHVSNLARIIIVYIKNKHLHVSQIKTIIFHI